jgi:hypothetical protein
VIRLPFAPKRPAWFAGTAVVIAAALVIYLVWSAWAPWRPGRAGGLTFGTIAGLVFLFDGLYPLRRRLLAWPLGTAQRWLQVHIYGGAVAFSCVLMHVGFAWPTGPVGWWLLGLSFWTTASGLFGVALQKWIPSVVADSMRVEALASRMPELTARLLAEADRVMTGASDRLASVYQTEIRPALLRPEPAWIYVSNVQKGRNRYARSLDALDRAVPDPVRVSELRAIVTEKSELDVHLSLQRALRGWLLLHVPPAVLLLGLLAVHVFAALYL